MTRRTLPPHVYRKKGVIYFQRRGFPTVKIASAEGSPEFHAEYARLLAGDRPIYAGPRTFAALVADYRTSKRWRDLAPRTQADYDKVLVWVTDKFGGIGVIKLQRKDVIRAQSVNAKTVRFANYIVQVLRVLCEHAIDLGWLKENPAKGIALLRSTGPKREAWPQDKIAAFRKEAGPRARLIFEMCLGTGQRIGDVLRMRWSDIEGDGINVKQGKTGAKLWVPFTRQLAATLAETPKIGATICAWGRGKPTSYRGAADLIYAVRVKIGAEAWDIHALRYSAASELAAAGCSDELIKAVTGHQTSAMVVKYAGSAMQRARATEAQGRRK